MASKHDSSREFIEEYINFIARVGKSHPSKFAWWATWIASRNRLLSSMQKNLENIFEGKPAVPATSRAKHFIQLLYAWFVALKYSIRNLVQIFSARVFLRGSLREIQKKYADKPVYLIKTFSLSHCFDGEGFKDVFFGRLPQYLSNEKKLNLLTVFDSLGGYKKALKKCQAYSGVFPFHSFLRAHDILKAWLAIFRGLLVPMPKNVRFLECDVTRTLRQQYEHDLLSSNTIMTYLIYYAFKRIAREFNLSHVLLTTENNPWERLCILAVREESPKTRIIGYQHTVTPQAATGMFPGKEEMSFTPLPDLILTVGSETADILKEYGHYGSFPVTPACAVRFEYLEKLPVRDRPINRVLLIALEGYSEAAQMLDYALSQMQNHLEWKVIIRTHPFFSYEQMKKASKIDLSMLAHVELSEAHTVSYDLNRAGAVIYWGSSVGVEALRLGMPVIHYHTGSMLSYDPLFRCTAFKWTVDSGDDLFECLELIAAIPVEQRNGLQRQAQDYLEKYFYKVTPERLAKFIP